MAWRLGVAVLVVDDDSVTVEGYAVSGYFDEYSAPPVIVLSKSGGEQKWVGVLLHEYCHATQWFENQPFYTVAGNCQLDAWLGGKLVKNIDAQIKSVQEMEADNERRTVRLAKELNAPLDIELYCQAANAYIHFHNVMAAERRWYKRGQGPYQCPEILELCNKTIDSDFKKTPKALFEAIAKRIRD